MSRLTIIEVEQEVDGRWLADLPDIPGVMAYGDTEKDAIRNVLLLLEMEYEPPYSSESE